MTWMICDGHDNELSSDYRTEGEAIGVEDSAFEDVTELSEPRRVLHDVDLRADELVGAGSLTNPIILR